MKCMFLEKFFPEYRTTTIRKEICGIRQHPGESLTMMDQSMIDAASGGALMDKTSIVARHMISNMASTVVWDQRS
ncbi:hypothetical protein CR513_12633, partial [Mucuna pruriens]